jgi:hypothetical protein
MGDEHSGNGDRRLNVHEHWQKTSATVDKHVQELGTEGVKQGREWFKLPSQPGDGFYTRMQKAVFNKGVDVLADHSTRLLQHSRDFAGGVAGKVIGGTVDRLNPMHLQNLWQHPELLQRYGEQRKNQLMQPVDMVMQPKEFAQRKWQDAQHAGKNAWEHWGNLEGGTGSKLAHGGRAAVDLFQEKLAPMVGLGLTSVGIFNMAQQRLRTNAAMNSMFPSGTMRGAIARFPVNKFFVAKPMARLVGNPRLVLGMAAYGVATSIGKSIGDSMKLKETMPGVHQRLTASGNETYRSSLHLDMHQSTQATKRKP